VPRSTESVQTFAVVRAGVRLDKFLADASGCGRRTARSLIREGRVLLDGRSVAPSTTLVAGQSVEIVAGHCDAPIERPMELAIIQEASDFIAVAKPAGMHSVAGNSENSAAAALGSLYPETRTASREPIDGGLVHRLDRDTSGVLLAARNPSAWRRLRCAFSEHRVRKHYLALVGGEVRETVTIDQPLARRNARVGRPHRGEKSFEAQTSFYPLETAKHWSLVLVSMRTGVTHQIRAHAALAGFAILGDMKYGSLAAPVASRDGQLLHALRLEIAGELDVAAPVDADFKAALAALRGD